MLLPPRKICSSCGIEKSLDDFHKRIASPDGLAYKCKDCVNRDSRIWRENHQGAHKEWYARNRDHKAAYFRAWREKHRETEPERMAEWARKNPGKVNAKIAKRNAAKLRAIPPWADLEDIRRIYAEAARLRRETGQRYEVDHIVPLQGEGVCGLHWSGNLQIILKAENISKLNRRWPGMPTI